MKNYQIAFILISFLLTFSACREITVTTIINEDGSFTRVVKVDGDSSSVFKMNLPYPIDDTWTVDLISKKDFTTILADHPEWSISMDTSIKNDFILTYRKTYNNISQLNKEIKTDTGWRKNLVREVDINKRFGFFYSYLTFREVYKAANPFTKVNIHDYLTNDELMVLKNQPVAMNKADSLHNEEIEEKAFSYLKITITEEVIETIENGIKQLNNPQLNNVNINDFKDSVAAKLDDANFKNLSDFIGFYAVWTGLEAFGELNELAPSPFTQLDNKWKAFEEVMDMESYTQQVIMPGLITETNSIEVVGNQVSWKVDAFPILLVDFEMVVESRVVNYWAFILSGIVLLLLIIFLTVKAFRQKH